MKDKPLAFSFSSTEDYANCGYRFQQQNLLKNYPEEEHPAATRGNLIHDHLDQCLRTDTAPEGEYERYQWCMDMVRELPGLKMPEMNLNIDRAWRPCGTFDEGVWYRGKIDVTVLNGSHATVYDWKTGQHRLKPRQANDYALLVMLHFKQIETLDFYFVWTDAGVEPDRFEFSRERDWKEMLETMRDIPAQIEQSQEDDEWLPIKSGLCNGYCPVVDCKHWKPKLS